jgi:hypothetical protein
MEKVYKERSRDRSNDVDVVFVVVDERIWDGAFSCLNARMALVVIREWTLARSKNLAEAFKVSG